MRKERNCWDSCIRKHTHTPPKKSRRVENVKRESKKQLVYRKTTQLYLGSQLSAATCWNKVRVYSPRSSKLKSTEHQCITTERLHQVFARGTVSVQSCCGPSEAALPTRTSVCVAFFYLQLYYHHLHTDILLVAATGELLFHQHYVGEPTIAISEILIPLPWWRAELDRVNAGPPPSNAVIDKQRAPK